MERRPAESERADHRTLVVATLTYRRPEGIRRLVPALVDQAARCAGESLDVRIVVVDNDRNDSARVEVEKAALAAAERGVEVHYEHEPRPGISAARNRAMDAAGEADLLAFIDDDGEPTEQWLERLLAAADEFGAAGVVGRMEPVYEIEPEPWVRASQAFERPYRQTGTPMPGGPTNNLLFDLRLARRHRIRFDDDMSITGGGDSLFTRQLVSVGAKFVACDEALALDHIPPERLTRGWVLRRRFRFGTSHVLMLRKLAKGRLGRLRAVLQSLAKAWWELVCGSVLVLRGILQRSLSPRARGEMKLARALGRLSGVTGTYYREYRRPQ